MEDRILDVCRSGSPLNDIRCAGHECRDSVAKCQLQCRTINAGCCQRTSYATSECRTVEHEVEGQADGIPHTVLIERTATESDVCYVAVGIADVRAVVASIGQTDGGRSPIVVAAEEDAVLVNFYHAVVHHENAAVCREVRNEACLLTLGGAHGLRIIAVVDGASATYEGVAMVDGRFALCHRNVSLRSIERVSDIHLVAVGIPAYESAAQCGAVSGQQATVVDAARDVHAMIIAIHSAHDATMTAIAIDAAVNDSADVTVGNVSRTFDLGDKSSGKITAGIDVACHLQILDGATIDIAERCTELFGERL